MQKKQVFCKCFKLQRSVFKRYGNYEFAHLFSSNDSRDHVNKKRDVIRGVSESAM